MVIRRNTKTRIEISSLVEESRKSLDREKNLSSSFKENFNKVLEVIEALTNYLGINSSNSSIPPSQDPNRPRKVTKAKGLKRKQGGQKGHKGSCLLQVKNPTVVEEIQIDRESLPLGNYSSNGFSARQVFNMEVSLVVTEYRAEILINENGVEFTAKFPDGVTEPAQYGNTIKVHSVYMSQFQLVPLNRIKDHFNDQLGLPISKGSISNWNILAYKKLSEFETWARQQLITSPCNNADETGINVGGKRLWLHCVSNLKMTLFHADEKRGQEAMERMGILPHFRGKLIHDHWKAYFVYDCIHALCNGHHLRELEAANELDGQKWAKKMQELLLEMKKAVDNVECFVSKKRINKFIRRYRHILREADKECSRNPNSRAQSKSRNLLERLRDFEEETLLFLKDKDVPFTNNRGENDLRMTKVQQKISGCFRSLDGAKIFCRIRSYILTCMKNGIGPSEALKLLFDGELPNFMK